MKALMRAALAAGGAIVLAAIFYSATSWAEDRGSWFKSLKQPLTGASCCDVSDCVAAPDAQKRDGQWWATVQGEMTPIPNEKILRDKWSYDGKAYVCSGYGRRIYCFVEPGGGV